MAEDTLPQMPEQKIQAIFWDEAGVRREIRAWTPEEMLAHREEYAAARVAQAVAQERALRRLLAVRVAMACTYGDDGEMQGSEHGIFIDFMREPVADIDAKLRALNVARAICAAPQPPSAWRPISEAPRETELLVGRFVNGEWRVCQSGLYFDEGNEREGEPSSWYWHCDWDQGGVTDGDGPTHWQPLPPPPSAGEEKP